jgi:hypothetical protein
MLLQFGPSVVAPNSEMGDIIRGAIAPVFLLSGIGTFMLVFTQRLARVIDRVRALEEASGAIGGNSKVQLVNLEKRRHCILQGIRRLTLSAHAVSAVVVMLFLDYFTSLPLDKVVAVLFMASMLLFSAALLCLLQEVSLVVHGTPEDS